MTNSKEENKENNYLPSVQFPVTRSYTYMTPIPPCLVENLANKVNEPCVLGVDEAGRGPCLGPMVYAVSFCPLSRYEEFKALGFDDSKKLTHEKRLELADIIQKSQDYVGWAVKVISPQDISTSMFNRVNPVNLNQLAHNATMELISMVIDSKVNLTEVYVDPVGPSKSYQDKLTKYFQGITFTVEPKADALYPIVSAASICAKVTRDQITKHWIWTEPGLELSKEFGSGYPSDPNTVRWLDDNEVPFFGYPSIIRFSWKTISNRLDESSPLEWSDEEDEEKRPKKGAIKRMFSTNYIKKKEQGYEKGKFYKSFKLDYSM
ncbi:unnamed protein product [Cunninghamella blakesleeana]